MRRKERKRDLILFGGGILLGVLGNLVAEFGMRLYDLVHPEININVAIASIIVLILGICAEVYILYKWIASF